LKEIFDPPLVLYLRGNPEILTQPGIAMVSTRHATPYGLGMADRLARARVGDPQRHGAPRLHCQSSRGDRCQGKTIVVFGTGADIIYPKETSRLSEQILAREEALISEFCMGAFAAPQNFPIRNRI
jgi:DNA processing protein